MLASLYRVMHEANRSSNLKLSIHYDNTVLNQSINVYTENYYFVLIVGNRVLFHIFDLLINLIYRKNPY